MKIYFKFTVTALLFILFYGSVCLAQIDSVEGQKGNVFKYHEDDPVVLFDIGSTIGGGYGGVQYGFVSNLDVYHIMIGYNFIANIPVKQKVTQNSLLMGYRYRTEKIMVSLASGVAWQKFKCTSGLNHDCYDYVEETVSAIPLNFQIDGILSDYVTLGLTFHNTFSRRINLTTVLFTFKVGVFRNLG